MQFGKLPKLYRMSCLKFYFNICERPQQLGVFASETTRGQLPTHGTNNAEQKTA